MKNAIEFIGRLLIAQLFLVAGIRKIFYFATVQSYMQTHHVPGGLLWLVILFEIGSALLLILGLWTRWVAISLALFCILAAILFHSNWSDGKQYIYFSGNLTMAGGLLILAIRGTNCWSICKKII